MTWWQPPIESDESRVIEPAPTEPVRVEETTDEATRGILSASWIMASGTLVSRLTGFVRAACSPPPRASRCNAEVFNVANTIPNSIYILVAGGVFNTVLVPQLVRAIKNDPDGGDAYANRIITLGAIVLAGVTAVLVLAAPLLLRAGRRRQILHRSRSRRRARVADRLRPLVSAADLLLRHVRAARADPERPPPVRSDDVGADRQQPALDRGHRRRTSWCTPAGPTRRGYTTGAGGAARARLDARHRRCRPLILLPYLRASGFRIHPRFDFRGTGLGHTLRLGMWTVGFVIVNQLAFYVMVHRATSGPAPAAAARRPSSGYTVYANAFLFTQVPHSIVTVSLATATMPLRLGDGRRRTAARRRPRDDVRRCGWCSRSSCRSRSPCSSSVRRSRP